MAKSFTDPHRLSGLACLLGALTLAAPAAADLDKQGDWPAEEKKVSLDVDHVPREEIITKVAEKAGWSVVLRDTPTEPMSLHVKDQPADKLLSLLLSEGHYVAKRDGTLISIERAPAAEAAPAAPAVPAVPAAPAAPPVPPVPPVPGMDSTDEPPPAAAAEGPKKGEGKDREVVGQSLTIEKDEVVRNVHLIGGSLVIRGVVTGDAEVVGGRVQLDPGARVMGDIEVMGGSVRLMKGARLDGDADIVGGKLEREEGALVGGDISTRIEGDDDEDHGSMGARVARELGECMTAGALLFALGSVMIALFTRRSEMLKVEIAARPMRTFALGVAGFVGSLALAAALCVTVIGIPVAAVGLLALMCGTLAAMTSVLEVLGRALVGHKTKNEYAHLALGCALFVGVMAIPVVDDIAKVVLMLMSLGSLVATRGAGLLPQRKGAQPVNDGHPYRSAEVV